MSLAQFNDFLEVCCEMMNFEEKAEEMERVEVRNDRLPDGNKWWEHAVREIEKEKELLHV